MLERMPDAFPDPDASARPQGAERRAPRRALKIGIGAALVVALAGGYVAACALAPLPELRPEISGAAEQRFAPAAEAAAAVQSAVDAQRKPSAVGWADGTEVWSNDGERPRQIASITKLVTVLVCLDAKPLAAGADGPSYTVTEADERIREEVQRSDGVIADTPVGQKLTTRQLIELAMLPSANNYAISYARWVFGSDEKFLAAAAQWAERNELKTLRITEPSGLSERNVAGAADLVRLGRIALQNPLVAEIAAEPWAKLPGIGPISNTNPLLGDRGVIGLKTGTLSSAGYNLLAARTDRVGDRDAVIISVALDRADGSARAKDSRALLRIGAETASDVVIVDPDAAIGSVRTWQGESVPLRPARGSTAALLPGESAKRSVEIDRVGSGDAGRTIGVVRVAGPGVDADIPVVTGKVIVRPDLWWRVTHPATAFEGYFGG